MSEMIDHLARAMCGGFWTELPDAGKAVWRTHAIAGLKALRSLGPVTADFTMNDGKGGRKTFQAPIDPPEELGDYIDAILAEAQQIGGAG